MLSRDQGLKFFQRLCRLRLLPVRLLLSETVVMKNLFLCFGVWFCTARGEAAAVVSGKLPDDVAGGEVRSTGGLNLPLLPQRCQKGFCWNGWDETCGNFVEEDEALLSASVLLRWQVQVLQHLC